MNKKAFISGFLSLIILFLAFIFLFIKINFFSNKNNTDLTAELRKSASENLIKNPLTESPFYKNWNLYKSRFENYSFSLPNDWVIKECQENEDCEYYPATRINKINEENVFLQFTLISGGVSQCIFGLNSKNNQIDSNQFKKLKYGAGDFKIHMPVKHNNWCFEIIGNYTNDSEKEILIKILSSFRFAD